MPDFDGQSGTRMNKNANGGPSPVTGMLRYRTEIQDAGMPAASAFMPMPNYQNSVQQIDSLGVVIKHV
jgi:hypothetical protein